MDRCALDDDLLRARAEQARLDALQKLDIFDTPQEEVFDRATRLIKSIFGVAMSTITFVDGHRQWFKSHQGAAGSEGRRDTSFCNRVVHGGSKLLVTDATTDPIFKDNPLVVGPPHIRFYAGVPLTTREGLTIGTLCIVDMKPRAFDVAQMQILTDIAAIVSETLEMRRLATLDVLTGIHTRRAFLDEFERELAMAKRHGHDVSLIVLDVDHFKRINDTYGHKAGDAVLMHAVDVCRQTLRKTDVIGRLGGEEFAIVLPYVDELEARAIAGTLRQAVEASLTQVGDNWLQVTASFGVVTAACGEEDAGHLLEIADQAMYRAKNSGRNSIVVAENALGDQADIGQRVLKAGRIVCEGSGSEIECTVRRMSKTKADLRVNEGEPVPANFKLCIEADGFAKLCRIVQREGSRITVALAA